ncbi:Uncharacterised protein [Vibrio cholerae]|nr:Uncharacterised protein [Vibrio cholerae]
MTQTVSVQQYFAIETFRPNGLTRNLDSLTNKNDQRPLILMASKCWGGGRSKLLSDQRKTFVQPTGHTPNHFLHWAT